MGNFKTKSSKDKDYTPLYRLVSLEEGDVSTGILSVIPGLGGGSKESRPLPDAEPPWGDTEEEAEKGEKADEGILAKLKKFSFKAKEEVLEVPGK